MRSCLAAVAFVCLTSLSLAQSDDRWESFRGGARAGVSESPTLPLKWSTTENVVWTIDVPGRGWSSPVVWKDKIFVTTVVSEQELQAARKGLYIEDLRGKNFAGDHRWLVLCLDFATGKELWRKEVHKGKAPGTLHIKNSFASETPVVDGERVYAYFGNVGVFCLDHAGKLLWQQAFPPVKTRMGWGPAASPALHRDRLFIINDNEERSYLVALDAKSGKEGWRVERETKSNWATPFVWESANRTEVITAASEGVQSYDLDGKPLWFLKGMSILAIPTPFAAKGLLFVSSGYVLDGNRPVYAIRPGAKGDISLKSDQQSNDYVAWVQRLAGPYHPTPIVYGDYIYVLLDRGFFACYEAKTGKKMYDKQRLMAGASGFTASPVAYRGHLFCLSEDGETFVIKAGPKFELVGKNALEDMALATPALANGSLLVRTQSKLYHLQTKN